MKTRVELWLRFKDKYKRALSIPLKECQRFAVHPLAWLSYVASTIYGSVGYLSMSPDGPEIDCHVEAIQPGTKYYYVSQDPRLLDPDMMQDRTSIKSATTDDTNTTRRDDFRQRVIDRDKGCILTGGNAENVEACHIIPHAKGDQAKYMTNVINIRSGETVDPPFDGINDTRNGILLHPSFQRGFGESRLAFLRTPNDFMDVYDVDRVLQPNANLIHASSADPGEKRLTSQHFDNTCPVVRHLTPHNCDAHLPDTISADWPPDLMFDASYGTAAIKAWGTSVFRDFIRNATRAVYYDDDYTGGYKTRGNTNANNSRNELAERAANRAKRRNRCRQASPDIYDILLEIWTLNARERQREARAVEEERTKEKVQTWLDSAV